jgi:two-component system, NarL family, sensor histidine kinase DesK
MEGQRFSVLIRLATAGVFAYTLLSPVLTLYRILTSPIDPGRTVPAVAGFACFFPILVWLLFSAIGDRRGRSQLYGLAAMWVVVAAMVPVVGAGWLGMFLAPAALLLIYVRLPWSFLLLALVVVVPTPVGIVFGHADWGVYFSFDVVRGALPMTVGLWLVRVARQLQAARQTLAEEAVVRERVRIDGDLREAVGSALEGMSLRAGRAAGAVDEPEAAERDLAELADASRRTLADTRRTVRRYREVSLQAELESAVSLLAAAGIQANVELPPEGLPDRVDEEQRSALRWGVTRLLGDRPAPTHVLITVARKPAGLELELRPSP